MFPVKKFSKPKIHHPCIAVRYRLALKQTHKKLHKNRTDFLFPNIETKNLCRGVLTETLIDLFSVNPRFMVVFFIYLLMFIY